jgi:hypothetical protein
LQFTAIAVISLRFKKAEVALLMIRVCRAAGLRKPAGKAKLKPTPYGKKNYYTP